MTCIVQLSDTHFGTEILSVMQAAHCAVRAINPDIVILSGDITQRATVAQFAQAKAFMDALHAEVKLCIAGNHDLPLFHIPMRLFNPYRRYQQAFGAREGVHRHGNVVMIRYDATCRLRHTQGKLTNEHVLRLLEEAQRITQQGDIVIACAHQPLAVALPVDRENILLNAPAIASLFSERGVDMVLSGHIHWPICTTTHAHYAQLTRHFMVAGCGTTISRRLRVGAPNSFNVIHTNDEGEGHISVTLMEYDKKTRAFEASIETRFRKAADGWHIVDTHMHRPDDRHGIVNYGAKHC